MFPDPNHPQQPGQPSGPGIQPQPPHYDYGTPDSQQAFQRHANGQYEVVPTPVQNTGRPSGHNPYEFIVAPAPSQPKGNPFAFGKSSWKGIAVLLGGLLLLLLVFAVVVAKLAPKGSTPGLISITQRQEEIIRVATAAETATTDQDTKNFVANVHISVGSSQTKTLSLLSSMGSTVSEDTLKLGQDPQTDSTLASATTNGTYNHAVVQNLTSQLQTYQTLLQTTYKEARSQSAKDLVQANYDTADTLLTQAKALSGAN